VPSGAEGETLLGLAGLLRLERRHCGVVELDRPPPGVGPAQPVGFASAEPGHGADRPNEDMEGCRLRQLSDLASWRICREALADLEDDLTMTGSGPCDVGPCRFQASSGIVALVDDGKAAR
jgi:hypothetical protein